MRALVATLLGVASAGADFQGGALFEERGHAYVAAWGDGLRIFDAATGRAVGSRPGRFLAGGCAFDVDRDGRTDLILNEATDGLGVMVWLRAPRWDRFVIDTETGFRDCSAASLLGERGVLITHRQMQVRHYRPPPNPTGRWPYRELYSIYTASAQSGLAFTDVDRDGHPDILHGNYWIQSPAKYDLPWRLFALNQWWDTPRSAMLRLALLSEGEVIAAESEASPARIARFRRPEDARLPWQETRVNIPKGLRRPQALAVREGVVYVGENAGPGSRLLRVEGPDALILATSDGYLEVWPRADAILTLGPAGMGKAAYLRK